MDFYSVLGGGDDLGNILGLLAVLFALAAAVLAVLFIVPKGGKEKKGFMGNVQRVCCFEGVFLNKLLTLIFVYGTVYCVLSGLFDIINGLPVFPCLETIFVHPLVLRLLLEVAKLLAIGVKALTEINAKLKNETAEPLEFQAAPKAPVASVGGAFCPHCGSAVDAGNAFCAHCGKSIQ